ncbi:hypothetical protein ACFYNO_22090 [Kitasatospora sp. NPDC006697]|uniref:hypothetical protein n=1 Tax=Kitasatospora sp. NPDC006697 TaxID=3364020 RepID=UPI00367855F1
MKTVHRRSPLRALAATVAAAALGLAATALPAAAAQPAPPPAPAQLYPRTGIVPLRTGSPGAAAVLPSDAPADGLRYRSGPLAKAPKVYLDFWGSQWYADDPAENAAEGYLQGLFLGLGSSNDTWSTITSQYAGADGSAPVFDGPVLAGVLVDSRGPAPARSEQPDIAAEAQYAAQYFGVSGPDVDIVVVSPSGTHPDAFPDHGFCAWHSWTGSVAYTNLPFLPDVGSLCGAGTVQGPMDGFGIVAGHEYAEAITDPVPFSGWTDPNYQEIGDLCAWSGLAMVGLGPWRFPMQPLYSNRAGGCVLSS